MFQKEIGFRILLMDIKHKVELKVQMKKTLMLIEGIQKSSELKTHATT